MTEIQSSDFLQTSVSLTDSIPTKFMNLHKKIQSISQIRKEIKKQKQAISLQTKILRLQENSNRFMAQAEGKMHSLRAELAELKLAVVKSEKEISVKRSNRQQKITLLKKMLVGVLNKQEDDLSVFEQKCNQKCRDVQQRLAKQSIERTQSCRNFEAKLCSVLPKTYQIITISSQYQQNKLQSLYQAIKSKTSSLKQSILDFQEQQYQKLVYITGLLGETAQEISNDLENQRKQRQIHRFKILKLIQQTEYHNNVQNT